MVSSPNYRYFLIRRSKYDPQHPILQHLLPIFIPKSETPNFTHTHTHTHAVLNVLVSYVGYDISSPDWSFSWLIYCSIQNPTHFHENSAIRFSITQNPTHCHEKGATRFSPTLLSPWCCVIQPFCVQSSTIFRQDKRGETRCRIFYIPVYYPKV